MFAPCLVLITAGLVLLAMATTRSGLILSAIVFGTGFGTAYPVFAAYVTHGVREDRRGAAFGAILAAFDTGIGTGSSSLGWLVANFGYGTAFGVAAALSALALPAFFLADRQVGLQAAPTASPAGVPRPPSPIVRMPDRARRNPDGGEPASNRRRDGMASEDLSPRGAGLDVSPTL